MAPEKPSVIILGTYLLIIHTYRRLLINTRIDRCVFDYTRLCVSPRRRSEYVVAQICLPSRTKRWRTTRLGAFYRLIDPYTASFTLEQHLRIVDKFSVNPPTTYVYLFFIELSFLLSGSRGSSRYLGSDFNEVLPNELVEYKQANLTIPGGYSIALCSVQFFSQPSLLSDMDGR